MTEDDLHYSVWLGKFRWKPFRYAKKRGIEGDTKNSRNFFENKAPWYRSFIGACGEKAYSKFSNWPIIETTWNDGRSFEDGSDFPNGFNVKASEINNMPNLLIPVDQWDRHKPKGYILAWVRLRERECFLLGQALRTLVDEKKIYLKKGERKMKVDTYWTDREYLSIADLF